MQPEEFAHDAPAQNVLLSADEGVDVRVPTSTSFGIRRSSKHSPLISVDMSRAVRDDGDHESFGAAAEHVLSNEIQ